MEKREISNRELALAGLRVAVVALEVLEHFL